MNITFLVGNGFDIAAGIQTSYAAFYEWYCNQPSDKECLSRFKQEIKNDIRIGGENWADFELGLGQYTAKFTPETVFDFFDCYEDAHENMIKYIREQNNRFLPKGISGQDVNNLKNGLLNFYSELSPKEQSIIGEVLRTDRGNSIELRFLSFNYSGILDHCVALCAQSALKNWQYGGSSYRYYVASKVCHVHGTVNEFPILGVNDSSQIANKDLLVVPQFSDIMIKPQSVDTVGQLWHSEAISKINSSDVICILGMSLGKSDSQWWKRIVTWLKNGTNRHLIIFWYSKNPPNGISIFKHTGEINSVKDILFDYTDMTKSEFKKIESRIHVIINTKKVLQIPKSAISADEKSIVEMYTT